MSRVLLGVFFIFALTAHAGVASARTTVDHHDSAQRERRCMADAIYHEARGESRQGKIAIGNVIMNRVNSGAFPSTICGVVYQRNANSRGCQFSWACKRNTRIAHPHLWEDALIIAAEVIDGRHRDYSRGAIYFNNVPFRNKRLTARIGNHYFYNNRSNVNRFVEVAQARGD